MACPRPLVGGHAAGSLNLAVRSGLVGLLLVLGGCGTTSDHDSTYAKDGPLVGPEAGGGMGISVPGSKPETPYPFGTLEVCVPRGEEATVESLSVVDTKGPLDVQRMGVRLLAAGQTTHDLPPGQPIPNEFDAVKGYRAAAACDSGDFDEFAVQLSRTGSGDASLDGLELRYTLGGHKYVDRWPVTIILCDPAAQHASSHCGPEPARTAS